MSKKPASAGKIVGITCASIFGAFIVLPGILASLAFSGIDGLTSLVYPIVIGLIVFLVIRSRRRSREAANLGYPTESQPAQAAYSAPIAAAPEPIQTSGMYATTVCQHSFSADDLTGKASVTCPCGHTFQTKDLLDYQSVSAKFLKIEQDLSNIRQRLIASMNRSAAPAPAQVAASVSTQPKPQVRKAKTTLSLQQWLIMGASGIIVFAGSVFVSVNLNTLPSEAFLAVTMTVGIGTGVLAFWGRKFSVMLANFMATFSSAMLMFALLVVGDIFFPFRWDTAPASWWTLDLFIVSSVAVVLTRFKSNFGWKIISIAGLAATGLVFAIGELGSRFEFRTPSFGWISATLGLTGLLIALASDHVSKFKFAIDKGTPDHEYEIDLAKREDGALKKFTFYTFALFMVLALQWPITSGLALGSAPEPVSFTAFALVTVLALVTRSIWSGAVLSEESSLERLTNWMHIFAFTTVSLTIGAWVAFAVEDNYWSGLFGTIVIIFATVGVGFNIKRFAEFPVAVQTAQIATALSWIIWYAGRPTFNDSLAAVSLLLIAFAASMLYQSWLGVARSSVTVASIIHFIGVSALVLRIVGDNEYNPLSVEHALISLGVIAVAVCYAPATALVNRKLGKEFDLGAQNLIFILTTLVAFAMTFPGFAANSPADYLLLAAVTGGSALVAGIGSTLLAQKQQPLSSLLLRYSFAFQGMLVVSMLYCSRGTADMIYPGLTLLALAALNYAMAWVGKIKSSVWVGYGSSIAGLVLLAYYQKDELLISAHLALMIVLALALNYLLRIVDKKVEAKYTNYFSLISVFGLTASSFVLNYSEWRNSNNSDQILLGLLILVLVAGLAAGFAELERFGSGRNGLSLRIAGLTYLLLAFVTVASSSLNENLNSSYGAENLIGWRRILVAAVFAVIVFRQLQISSKAKSLTTTGWFALSYLAPVTVALLASDLLRSAVDLDKFNLELVTVPLAIAIALPAIFNSALPSSLKRLVGLDVPLLFPVAALAIYSLSQDVNEDTTMYRLVASTAILAGYSFWRFGKSKTLLWAVLEYSGLLGLGLSLAQLVEVLAPNLLEGPELFGVGAAAAIVVGNIHLRKVVDFKSTIFTNGLPLFTLVLPSVLFTFTALDSTSELTSPTQITRIVSILVIALAALLLGVRNGNLGIALAGGASLSLLLLPITWASAGASSSADNTIALRALGISLFLFLFLGGLRSINRLPDSSYIYLGIPSVVALGPSLFITLTSIGDSSLTRVDWWRFGIIMAATITLLVVGALRSLGGLFFPGLVGVLVGVLPYAFQPIARESWFLWVVLLLIAGVMVWIAVRLEQLRKLGKSGASWIKTLH